MLQLALTGLKPCVPPRWARGPHLQTVLGHLLPSTALPEGGERIEIKLPGGDRAVARLWQAPGSRALIYFFHGLGGELAAAYMRRGAALCLKLGHSVILVNHRGRGEGKLLAREPYHSGRAEDLSAAIELGQSRLPEHRHLAIGFSLSGNALLLLLTGRRGKVLPDAAISVNAPINLARAARLLQRGFNRVYDLRFVYDCRQDLLWRARQGLGREYRVPRFGTLEQFDEIYTAPAGGFRDRQDYYDTCSTHELLHEIRVPTLALTAEDDPFVSFEDYRTARLSSSVILRAEKHGGHMGYLTRSDSGLGLRRWLDDALEAGITGLLQATSK